MHGPSSLGSFWMRIWTSSSPKLRLMSTINTEIFFKEGPGSLHCVRIGENSLQWANEKRPRRGLSYQLSPNQRTRLSFPAVDFTAAAPDLKKLSNDQIKIFVTTDSFFMKKFSQIFSKERDYDTPLRLNWKSSCAVPTSNIGLNN